jgi:hypothetical protein
MLQRFHFVMRFHFFFSHDFLIGNSSKLPQRFEEKYVMVQKKIHILHEKDLPSFLSDRFSRKREGVAGRDADQGNGFCRAALS